MKDCLLETASLRKVYDINNLFLRITLDYFYYGIFYMILNKQAIRNFSMGENLSGPIISLSSKFEH